MYPIHNEDYIHICIADRADEIRRLKARRQAVRSNRHSPGLGERLRRALARLLSAERHGASTATRAASAS